MFPNKPGTVPPGLTLLGVGRNTSGHPWGIPAVILSGQLTTILTCCPPRPRTGHFHERQADEQPGQATATALFCTQAWLAPTAQADRQLPWTTMSSRVAGDTSDTKPKWTDRPHRRRMAGPGPRCHTLSTRLGSYKSGHRESSGRGLSLCAAGCPRFSQESGGEGPLAHARPAGSLASSAVVSVFLELRQRMRDTEFTSFILMRRLGSALLDGQASFSCILSIALEGLRSLFSEPAMLGVLSRTWNSVDLKDGARPPSLATVGPGWGPGLVVWQVMTPSTSEDSAAGGARLVPSFSPTKSGLSVQPHFLRP